MRLPPPPELIATASNGALSYAAFRRIASEASRPCPEVLDDLATYVATQYAAGEMDFNEADKIMNAAWSICVSEEFWAEHDRTIPNIAHQVYEAFDAGEYYHPGDSRDVDPELKYTKPMVAAFLASQSDDASYLSPASSTTGKNGEVEQAGRDNAGEA